jgi:hypothetical protein
VNSLKGFVVNNKYELLITEDGGVTWNSGFLTSDDPLSDIFFLDEAHGWIPSDNRIYRTDDGGYTWNVDTLPTLRWMNSVFFTDSLHGLTCGYEGHILKCCDAGPVNVKEFDDEKLTFFHRFYPNPVLSSATIEYQLKSSCHVRIDIYDLYGHHIRNLKNGIQEIGMHRVEWNADHYNSGIYFYRIRAGMDITSGKIVFVK